jgi:hypothetical protein
MFRFKIIFPVLLVAAVAAVSAQIPRVQQPAVPFGAPQPQPPPLPSYHGQLATGPVVVLSLPNSAEKKHYRAGDKVGPFKLLSFDSQTITLDWNGKKIERKLVDLAPKEPPAAGSPSDSDPTPGFETGKGFRACRVNDNSPNGTIADGYKKVMAQGLMGKSCYWEKVN